MNVIGQIREQIDREVFDYQGLVQCLSAYAKPRDKIKRLLDAGDIVGVKKGLYVFGEAYRRAAVSRELLANLIYGPSYVSLDYALAWHGLIPERVATVTSVTTGRSREFSTPFGVFSYRSLSEQRYAVGAALEQSEAETVLLASPEKALADKVWTDKRFAGTSMADYDAYLQEDLRIDTDRLPSLDWGRLDTVRAAYSSRKIDRLVGYLQTFRETADA
jgi:predicted transcriptional regulator of viral defense system